MVAASRVREQWHESACDVNGRVPGHQPPAYQRRGMRGEHKDPHGSARAAVVGGDAHKAARVGLAVSPAMTSPYRGATPRAAKSSQTISTGTGLLAHHAARLGQIALDPPAVRHACVTDCSLDTTCTLQHSTKDEQHPLHQPVCALCGDARVRLRSVSGSSSQIPRQRSQQACSFCGHVPRTARGPDSRTLLSALHNYASRTGAVGHVANRNHAADIAELLGRRAILEPRVRQRRDLRSGPE